MDLINLLTALPFDAFKAVLSIVSPEAGGLLIIVGLAIGFVWREYKGAKTELKEANERHEDVLEKREAANQALQERVLQIMDAHTQGTTSMNQALTLFRDTLVELKNLKRPD